MSTNLQAVRVVSVTLLMLLLSACGGGGGSPGACVFGPTACGASGGSTGTGTGSGTGSTPSNYSKTGTGDTSFSLPNTVTLIRIQAQFSGTSSLFTVRSNNALLVSTVVGSLANPTTHDGTYVVPAGANIEIKDANGVAWTINSATLTTPSGDAFSRSGSSAAVFLLPNRPSRYRVTGTFSGSSTLFTAYADNRLIFSSVVGTLATPPSFDGIYSLPASAQIEIRDADGVSWTFVESP